MDETQFYLLHLSLMRDYLGLEFQELKETLPFEFDLESIIDDWVNFYIVNVLVFKFLNIVVLWYQSLFLPPLSL